MKQEIQKPSLILPIGISGSGKSTWANSFGARNNCIIIKTDNIRKELTGSISDQSKNKEVRKESLKRIIHEIQNENVVILDATNIYTDVRNDLVEEVRKFFPELVIYYKVFPKNVSLSKKRIEKDIEQGIERANVSEEVLFDQSQKYDETIEIIQQEGLTELVTRQFSLVYYLEGHIKDAVRELQIKISDLTGAKASLVEWEPHLTLASGPELSEIGLENLEKEIELFCEKQNSFDVVLKDFGGSNRRTGGNQEKTTRCVLWINAVENNQLSQAVEDFKLIINRYEHWYRMPEPYHPHVTLAFRDLDQDGYEKGINFLEGKNFHEIVSINHIALVEHLLNKDIEYKKFYLNK